MALPIAADLKSYLRIEYAAEDSLLAQLVSRATAAATRYMRRAILSTPRTFEDLTVDALNGRAVIFLPEYPIDPDSVTLTDADDVVVDDDSFRVDGATGKLVAHTGVSFDIAPYSVACDVGLATAEDYDAVIEPDLCLAILDIASDYWHRRNPAAQTESEHGVSTTYATDSAELPVRARLILDSWRKPRSVA